MDGHRFCGSPLTIGSQEVVDMGCQLLKLFDGALLVQRLILIWPKNLRKVVR